MHGFERERAAAASIHSFTVPDACAKTTGAEKATVNRVIKTIAKCFFILPPGNKKFLSGRIGNRVLDSRDLERAVHAQNLKLVHAYWKDKTLPKIVPQP